MMTRKRTSARQTGRFGGAGLLVVLCSLIAASCSLPGQPIRSKRNLSFDVPASLFDSTSNQNPGLVGPGIDSIQVTVSVIESGTTETTLPPKTLSRSQVPSGASYANLTISASGLLKAINVEGLSGSKVVVSTDLSAISAQTMSRYGGWTRFENLTDFEITWSGEAGKGLLRVVPCPRPSAEVLVDSGVQPSGGGTTDLAATLKTRQVALEVEPQEYDSDGNLTYDVYYAISSVDPSVAYNPALFQNTYLTHPWTAQWSYAEVTSGKGKEIGSTSYVMKKYPGGPHTAGKPDANGHLGVLVDLTGDSSATVGKYLLYCIVLHRAGLSVPTNVGVVAIR